MAQRAWSAKSHAMIRRALPPMPAPLGSPFVVTSPYGMRRHPLTGSWKMHHGIDLRMPAGWPVYALLSGIVVRIDVAGIGRGAWNGHAVVVAAQGWSISYLHLSAPLVVLNQAVRRDELIALSGATGPTTGPHLHLAVFWRGGSLDPALLFPPGSLTPA